MTLSVNKAPKNCDQPSFSGQTSGIFIKSTKYKMDAEMMTVWRMGLINFILCHLRNS
jgi:hypothetical protein